VLMAADPAKLVELGLQQSMAAASVAVVEAEIPAPPAAMAAYAAARPPDGPGMYRKRRSSSSARKTPAQVGLRAIAPLFSFLCLICRVCLL
jgi:hypothetical protein